MDDELQAAINRVPYKYAEFIPIMTTVASLELPQHSVYDHTMDVKDNTILPAGQYTHSMKQS